MYVVLRSCIFVWASQYRRDRLGKELVETAEDGTRQKTVVLATC